METVFLNGRYIPKGEAAISPDDRGFLFADSVYEVVRWYGGYFFDMEGHVARLKRSLDAVGIKWEDASLFPEIAAELIDRNALNDGCTLVYLQVTRGAAPRAHLFPDPPVPPTVYAFARRHSLDTLVWERGIRTALMQDPRWNRCDIKSTALLANILAYNDAHHLGCSEVIFARNGVITEAGHSNVFLVRDGVIYTHPESNFILSGITRKNLIRVAIENDLQVKEEAAPEDMLAYFQEAFITNTSGEVIPVVQVGELILGDGKPGDVTRKLQRLFREAVIRAGSE